MTLGDTPLHYESSEVVFFIINWNIFKRTISPSILYQLRVLNLSNIGSIKNKKYQLVWCFLFLTSIAQDENRRLLKTRSEATMFLVSLERSDNEAKRRILSPKPLLTAIYPPYIFFFHFLLCTLRCLCILGLQCTYCCYH